MGPCLISHYAIQLEKTGLLRFGKVRATRRFHYRGRSRRGTRKVGLLQACRPGCLGYHKNSIAGAEERYFQ